MKPYYDDLIRQHLRQTWEASYEEDRVVKIDTITQQKAVHQTLEREVYTDFCREMLSVFDNSRATLCCSEDEKNAIHAERTEKGADTKKAGKKSKDTISANKKPTKKHRHPKPSTDDDRLLDEAIREVAEQRAAAATKERLAAQKEKERNELHSKLEWAFYAGRCAPKSSPAEDIADLAMFSLPNRCDYCFGPIFTPLKCVCDEITYCSHACQQNDWVIHRVLCRDFVKK